MSTFFCQLEVLHQDIPWDLDCWELVPLLSESGVNEEAEQNARSAFKEGCDNSYAANFSSTSHVASTAEDVASEAQRSPNWRLESSFLSDNGIDTCSLKAQILDIESMETRLLSHVMKQSCENAGCLSDRLIHRFPWLEHSLKSKKSCYDWSISSLVIVSANGEKVKRLFRFPVGCSTAENFNKQLNYTVYFIKELREFFLKMRQMVSGAQEIRRNCQTALSEAKQASQSSKSFLLFNPLNFQREWYEALSPEAKDLLRVGIDFDEQSMLEEAIAYVPLTICDVFTKIPFLKEINFDQHRTWKDVCSLRTYYKSRVKSLQKIDATNSSMKEGFSSNNAETRYETMSSKTPEKNCDSAEGACVSEKPGILPRSSPPGEHSPEQAFQVNSSPTSPSASCDTQQEADASLRQPTTSTILKGRSSTSRASPVTGSTDSSFTGAALTAPTSNLHSAGVCVGPAGKEKVKTRVMPSSLSPLSIPSAGSLLGKAKWFPDTMKLFSLQAGQYKSSKSRGTCEDATFYDTDNGVFGVFDGVGSWVLEGIDASHFSIGLAEECKGLYPVLDAVHTEFSRLNPTKRARILLDEAHKKLIKERPLAWGSSTAVIGVFDEYLGTLGVACLGDSVLLLLRRGTMPSDLHSEDAKCPKASFQTLLGTGAKIPRKIRKILWKTIEQKWENGAPYQLANLPAMEKWESLKKLGYTRLVDTLKRVDAGGDSSSDAFSPQYPLLCQPGDLIIAFSDGVSDNLFDREIESYCSLAISPEEANELGNSSLATSASDIAMVICKIAKRRSWDKVFQEAFVPLHQDDKSQKSLEFSARKSLKGYKTDDISCVACWVVAETKDSIDRLLNTQSQFLKSAKAQDVAVPCARSFTPCKRRVRDSSPTPLQISPEKKRCRDNISSLIPHSQMIRNSTSPSWDSMNTTEKLATLAAEGLASPRQSTPSSHIDYIASTPIRSGGRYAEETPRKRARISSVVTGAKLKSPQLCLPEVRTPKAQVECDSPANTPLKSPSSQRASPVSFASETRVSTPTPGRLRNKPLDTHIMRTPSSDSKNLRSSPRLLAAAQSSTNEHYGLSYKGIDEIVDRSATSISEVSRLNLNQNQESGQGAKVSSCSINLALPRTPSTGTRRKIDSDVLSSPAVETGNSRPQKDSTSSPVLTPLRHSSRILAKIHTPVKGDAPATAGGVISAPGDKNDTLRYPVSPRSQQGAPCTPFKAGSKSPSDITAEMGSPYNGGMTPRKVSRQLRRVKRKMVA